MDKYEFQIKTEHMEKLLEKKDYKTAAKIADSIDWRKVHNVGLLTKVSEIYENLERYEDSFEILNMAYDNSPIGRMIVYKMAEVAVKMGDIDEAVELYKEFTKIAPHDLGRYVLKYEIYKARGSSIEDQIAILEEYKSREYQEQWAYELATLYYKEGMLSKCVEECDDLILWFSEGEYVVKAMELKMRIQPLTASQEEKYRQMADEKQAKQIEVKPVNMDEFNTTNLQAALAESLQDFIKEENAQELSPEPIPASPIREDKPEEKVQEEAVKTEEREEQPEIKQQLNEVKPAAQEQEPAKEEPVRTAPKAERENRWESVEEAGHLDEKPSYQERPLSRDTFPMPKFIGQNESGQLTFDMQENVLERQITGQMTIEDILSGWEEKKRETEAAIAEAAKRDEERRKEREHLRATGQLPDLNTEVVPTVPEEIQRLIDEIEGRLPVKVHVEPIMRGAGTAAAEAAKTESAKAGPVSAEQKAEHQAEPELPAEEIPDEILEILEGPAEKSAAEPEAEPVNGEAESESSPAASVKADTTESGPSTEAEAFSGPEAGSAEPVNAEPSAAAEQTEESRIEEWTLPENMDDIADILEAQPKAFLAAEVSQGTASAPEPEEAQKRVEEEEPEAGSQSPSPMMESLEKALEAEISSIPPGQLSEEQKKLFAYFTSVRGMNQQLAELLEEDRMRKERREDSLVGNIVITGEGGNGKTTLAADIVKALQKQRRVKGSKMAKVEASSLNGKSVSAVIDKLGGGALLIEKAGNLKTETAVQLSHAMTRKTGGLLVILEDEKDEIRKLFIRCESLGAKFTRTIDIPTFTNKELVAFGESYAQERECVLDEMAVLALYNRIGNNQTSDHLVNVAEVKEMVDEAIERGGKKGLFGKIKKSRMDEFGNTILLEKDFEL